MEQTKVSLDPITSFKGTNESVIILHHISARINKIIINPHRITARNKLV